MKTLCLRVDFAARLESAENDAALDRAAAILLGGGTVALPTETVYGLGANALDADAVARIFEAKGRPGWDPLIVHVSDTGMLGQVIDLPAGMVNFDRVEELMRRFWPGPLTLLLPRSAEIPDAVTAGRALVGVRMPAHPVARELIRRAGVPIAAPSANRFGHTSPTTAQHVLDDLDGRIDAVLDAGPTAYGVESTVVDASVWPMLIYRPGAVTIKQLREVVDAEYCKESEQLAELGMQSAGDELSVARREGLPSPGVGIRHYAPEARLVLIEPEEGDWDEPRAQTELIRKAGVGEAVSASYLGRRLGIMWPGPIPENVEPNLTLFPWGRWSNADELASRLFAGLRALDEEGCEVILCAVPAAHGIGDAIRDRLRKAAFRV